MTTFQDGPAKGQTLSLIRTPIFLRVTEANGNWDALNIPGDKPLPGEKLYAYIVAKHLGNVHIHASGGRGGWYPIVEYHFMDIQPPDKVMRSNDEWSKWLEAIAPRYKTHIESLMKP